MGEDGRQGKNSEATAIEKKVVAKLRKLPIKKMQLNYGILP